MKKTVRIFLPIVFSVLSFVSNAQSVSINNDGSQPDSSAILDIKSNSKGILIPRVALTGANDIATIASPKPSLLVYNTATTGSGSNSVEPGFYFWKDSIWIRIADAGNSMGSAWKLGGNSGTDTAKNFIGTTDNKPLLFKVNNQLSGHIDNVRVNTFFGYQAGKNYTTGWGSIGIGQNALLNNTTGYDNIAIGEGTLGSSIAALDNMAIGKFAMTSTTSGNSNVAIGNNSLQKNISGTENTAIGKATLHNNIDGYGNTALGFYSLFNNSSGYSNTALGRTTLYGNTTGYENVAIGRATLLNNTEGYQNTAIGRFGMQSNSIGHHNTTLGYLADVGANNLSNATAIGANAMVNCSNCLVLGSINGVNSATSDVNVGIGTSSPAQPLSFKNALGGKISFWNGGAGHYGIGVQSGLFQIYSDIQASDIAFGWGKSDAFNETMRVKGNGSVGIGTNAPVHSLDIRSASDLNRAQLRLHQNNTDFTRFRMTNTTSANFWDIAARPEALSSNAFLNFYYSAVGQNVLSLRGDGNAVLLGFLTQNSDLRLKQDIKRIENALGKISLLNGYNYHWINDKIDSSLQTGVLAQEVRKVFPELVKEDENGILSVNYSGLIPVMIEALKEQQKQIDELRSLLKAGLKN